jgi:hypothetical protein
MPEAARYRGIARHGKVELEPGISLPEGAEVTVLFSPASDVNAGVPDDSLEWLLQTMRTGFELGGGPYFERNDEYGAIGRPQ